MKPVTYIFFLIVLLPLAIPLAYAEIEHGKNFDRELIETNPDGSEVYQWTSSPERIFNDGIYENYLFTENNDYLRFESQKVTFEFYKDSCDFKLYDIGKVKASPLVESYSTTIAVNDNIINFPVCVIQNITQDNDGVSFDVRRGAATIFYDLSYITGAEWTYSIVGNGVITITEVCTNCMGIPIDDQRISIAGYTLDTKNDIHGAFDEATQQGNDFWIKYEAVSNGVIIIDPVFGFDGGAIATIDVTASAGAACSNTANGKSTAFLQIDRGDSGGSNPCSYSGMQYDVSSIDDIATVSEVKFALDATSLNAGGLTCQLTPMAVDISSASDQDILDDIKDGSAYQTAWTGCQSLARNELTLGSTANSDVEATLTGDDLFTLGILYDDMTRDGTRYTTVSSPFVTELEITYISIPHPDRVDDLTSTDIGYNTVNLDWTQPNLNTGNLTGYQVNYTTPWSSTVNTIITNDTHSSDTDAEVTGLSELTPYSFRIGVWTESSNMTGNVLNITTLEDFVSANFTPGFFDLNATNPDVIQMYFERNDINSTALFLNVTYPTAYDLSCDFSYEFANINQTYSSLTRTSTTHSGIDSAVESSFQFNNVDNEIIDVYCWDENNLSNDGQYVITQIMFPLLQQIADFRSGEFGTMGAFGAMDLITMFVIIISMIGFNRVNESVGAIFNIILLGSLAYFEVIELPTIIFGMIAVVIMVVIGTTRKK